MQFKLWLENSHENNALDRLFGSDPSQPRSEIVSVGKPRQEPYVLELYRGFDVNVDKLQRRGQYFILSPKKSEQGLIWFTHNRINGYDPKEYVRGRGSHLLVYPLHCIRHLQDEVWSDGYTSNNIPDDIQARTKSTENCRYYSGVELPEGWVFSYKHEKFIGCSVEIEITPDMLRANSTSEE
jgi:hypothetical protein